MADRPGRIWLRCSRRRVDRARVCGEIRPKCYRSERRFRAKLPAKTPLGPQWLAGAAVAEGLTAGLGPPPRLAAPCNLPGFPCCLTGSCTWSRCTSASRRRRPCCPRSTLGGNRSKPGNLGLGHRVLPPTHRRRSTGPSRFLRTAHGSPFRVRQQRSVQIFQASCPRPALKTERRDLIVVPTSNWVGGGWRPNAPFGQTRVRARPRIAAYLAVMCHPAGQAAIRHARIRLDHPSGLPSTGPELASW